MTASVDHEDLDVASFSFLDVIRERKKKSHLLRDARHTRYHICVSISQTFVRAGQHFHG